MTWDITYLFSPSEIESVFFENVLHNSKPISKGTIYHPPNQSSFLKVLNESMNKIDSINLSNDKSFPSDVKSYYEIFTFF